MWPQNICPKQMEVEARTRRSEQHLVTKLPPPPPSPPSPSMVRLARDDVVDTQGTASCAAVLHRCSPSHPRGYDRGRWFHPRPAPAYAAGPFLVMVHHKPSRAAHHPLCPPHHRLIVMGPESRETYAAVITSMRFARFSSQGHVLL